MSEQDDHSEFDEATRFEPRSEELAREHEAPAKAQKQRRPEHMPTTVDLIPPRSQKPEADVKPNVYLDDDIVGSRSVNLRLSKDDAKFLMASTTLNPSPPPPSVYRGRDPGHSGNRQPQDANAPERRASDAQAAPIIENVKSAQAAAERLQQSPPPVVDVETADPKLIEGSRIGNYEIIRKIGQGGMGVVYEGKHLLLPRRVAIKFLLTNQEHDEETIRRFLGEAVAAAQIGHKGVVNIYDYGYDQNNSAYLVMEYIEGQTLQAVMKRSGQLPVPMALRVVRDIAEVLAAAHQSGIVHRDLKPDNVILSRDEHGNDFAKVLDFGVAKFVDAAQSMSGKTQIGSILGTPWYMPPEQCQGSPNVDFRSDTYALGCVFYQMICGKVPFAGSLRDVLMAHLSAPPMPPSQLSPSVPPAVEKLILHMMEKDPNNRPSSMEQVARMLTGLIDPGLAGVDPIPNSPAPPAPAPTRNRWIVPMIAAVATGLVTAGVFYFAT